MEYSIKFVLPVLTVIAGIAAWILTNNHTKTTSITAEAVISKLEELETGKTDLTVEKLDGRLKELEEEKAKARVADAIYKGYTGVESNNVEPIQGAKQFVEERKGELLMKDNSR